jgi:hypothetical protein
MKFYYLVQTAFWLQQILVVNIEERRKDYWQMFTHHIFTSALLFSSYGIYQTKVGTVILVIMDVCEIILPVSSCRFNRPHLGPAMGVEQSMLTRRTSLQNYSTTSASKPPATSPSVPSS